MRAGQREPRRTAVRWLRAARREQELRRVRAVQREPRGAGASGGYGPCTGSPGGRGQRAPGSGSPGGCRLCTRSPGCGNLGERQPRWARAESRSTGEWEPGGGGQGVPGCGEPQWVRVGSPGEWEPAGGGQGAPVGAGGEPWGAGGCRTAEGRLARWGRGGQWVPGR